nr:argininosuccinate lyase [uncultured Shinella sp.]
MHSQVSPRLSQPLAREILELVFAPRIAREVSLGIDDLCSVNEAHLVMLAQAGMIEPSAARSIAGALSAMRAEGAESVPQDPAREDAYFNFEAALMERVGADVGGRLHLARSRNDINATLDRLALGRLLLVLGEELLALRRALLDRAQEHIETIMPGYTHLQPAQPITFGFYLSGIGDALARDTVRLFQAYDATRACPMGACAFAGTSFSIDRGLVADLLGFDGVHVHAQDAVSSRDYVWNCAASVLGLASTWGRFAQDLYIWGTTEFGLVRFPDSIAGTSSIMPQKKNPIAVEYLKAASGEVIGGVTATFGILKGAHFSHAGDSGRSALAPFWPVVQLATNAVRIARLVAQNVEAVPDVMASRAGQGFSTATDLADCLVREAGVSFRQAHHVVADLVRRATETGRTLAEFDKAEITDVLFQEVGRNVEIDGDLLKDCLDPRRSVAGRKSYGSTSPEQVRLTLERASEMLAADADALTLRRCRIESARDLLAKRLAAIGHVASPHV